MSQLTVVIPARNEAGRIGPAIRAVHRVLRSAGVDHDILVVDDASTDGTLAEAAALCPDHPLGVLRHETPLGKGGAVATGFRASTSDFCAFIDADLEFPPETLVQMWRELTYSGRPQAICAIGERRGDERSRVERLTSHLARTAIHLATGLPVRDTQAGIKMFPGWFARSIVGNLTERGWLFDVEALLEARRSRLVIASFPLRQLRLRPRRASAGEYLRCAVVLLRLVRASRAGAEVAAAREPRIP